MYCVDSSSFCAKQGLIKFKILHCTYWSKERLSRIYPHINPLCDRCKQAPASLIHMFLTCPTLHNFWTEIFNTIFTILKVPSEPIQVTILFGVIPSTLLVPKFKADFIVFTTLLARRLILLRWKSSTPPTVYHWLRELSSYSKLKMMRATMHGSTTKFYKIWNLFLQHRSQFSSPLPVCNLFCLFL